MIGGMAVGGALASQWTTVQPWQFLSHLGGMTLGMLLGMQAGCALGKKINGGGLEFQ